MASRAAPDPPRVHAIVLAAGRGSRMGRAKHLLPIDGVPMVCRVVAELQGAGIASLSVVLRPGDEEGRAALEPLAAEVLEAENPDEGRAASVRAGVRAAPRDAEALLLALADQPWLRADDYRALVERFDRGDAGMIRASYGGVPGTPVLFAARYCDELLRLRGREGGRVLLDRHAADVALVPLDPVRGRDLDRPEDLPPGS